MKNWIFKLMLTAIGISHSFFLSGQIIEHPEKDKICPDINETTPSVVSCDYMDLSGYNYIFNYDFKVDDFVLLSNSLDITNPFPKNQIPNWVETHGTPALSDFNSPSTEPPSGLTNYVSMYSWSNGENVFGEGVAQTISQLEQNKQYHLNFYKKVSGLSNGQLNLNVYYIVLLHCSDYSGIHMYPEYTIPDIPTNSQIIYLENSTTNEDWELISFDFTANSDYDMIWIFPKQNPESSDIVSLDITGVFLSNYIDGNFDCSIPQSFAGCNLIPNPGFSVINPSIHTSAFTYNNVPDWHSGYGFSDCYQSYTFQFGGLQLVTITPPPIPSINFAGIRIGNTYDPGIPQDPWEGNNSAIISKIRAVERGRKYALSFFYNSITVKNQSQFWVDNVTLKVALQKCTNYIQTTPPTTDILPLSIPNQLLYCEFFPLVAPNFEWKQVFITFEAEDDFEMIRIYGDRPNYTMNSPTAMFGIAYPQLIDITDFNAGTFNATNCTISPNPPNCNVANGVFTWTDPNGNTVQSSPNQTLNLNGNGIPGNYNLSLNVPNSINTNCLGNGFEINSEANVSSLCTCSNIQIINPKISFEHAFNSQWTTQNLSQCEITSICNGNEFMTFTATTNLTTNLKWEIFSTPTLNSTPWIFNSSSSSPNINPVSQSSSVSIDFITIGHAYGEFEIRLTNTITNEIKSLFVRLVPKSSIYNVCNGILQGYKKMIGIGENPYSNYTWNFNSPNISLYPSNNTFEVEFNDNSYAGPWPYIATLNVTANSGCPSYTQQVNIFQSQQLNCRQIDKSLSSKQKIKSINTSSSTANISVYPNPTSDFIYLTSKIHFNNLEIYNTEGKILYSKMSNPKYYEKIITTSYPKGIYYLKISYPNGQFIISKLIKL